MPALRRFLSPFSLWLPAGVSLGLFSVLMILIQMWLGSMAGHHGAVSVQSEPYYEALGVSWDGISHFRIWQLATYAVVHADWFHLWINLLMFWILGVRLIRMIGQKSFLIILLAGAVSGGVLHVLTDFLVMRAGFPGMSLVGISGACFAILLSLTTLSPDARVWPVPVSGKNLGLGVMIAEMLLWLMTPALGLPVFANLGEWVVRSGGGQLFDISHACHIGGALAGWLCARLLVVPSPSLEELRRARERGG